MIVFCHIFATPTPLNKAPFKANRQHLSKPRDLIVIAIRVATIVDIDVEGIANVITMTTHIVITNPASKRIGPERVHEHLARMKPRILHPSHPGSDEGPVSRSNKKAEVVLGGIEDSCTLQLFLFLHLQLVCYRRCW